MEAWQELSNSEYNQVWDRFIADFAFRLERDRGDGPAITEPTPSIAYSIASAFGHGPEMYRTIERDLNTKTLMALRACLSAHERVYALDWQHPAYWLYPHRFVASSDPAAWRVPVLPDGDYYIFLADDFRFGIFGHPWEQTLCVFGDTLLHAFAQESPLLFTKPIRKNGEPFLKDID